MCKIEAVLFDLDGTLMETSAGVLESLSYAVKELGLAPLTDEQMKEFIGPPIQDSFRKVCGMNDKQAQKGADAFRDHYKEIGVFNAVPYPGIFSVLDFLRDIGCKIGIATYKRHDYAMRLLEKAGFSDYCDSMNGADNFNVLSKADIVEKCLSEMGVIDRSKALLIGDSEYDAKGAKNAGVNFIGITYGFGFRTALDFDNYPSIGVANDREELLTLLKRFVAVPL